MREAVFRWRTPLVTARSKADVVLARRAFASSSFLALSAVFIFLTNVFSDVNTNWFRT